MPASQKEFDFLTFIKQIDGDELSEEEIIAGFQKLIDSGLAWRIEGRYGRFAQLLINDGKCKAKKKEQPPSPRSWRSGYQHRTESHRWTL